MRGVWIVVVVACSKPPPPKAPVVERPADQVADIQGRWISSDELDNSYTMTIEANGTIDVWIDRGKTGRCEQKGKIVAGEASRTFKVTYKLGECNPQAVNTPIDMSVKSFTGDELTIVVFDQPRSYTRVAEQEPRGERGAPVQLQ